MSDVQEQQQIRRDKRRALEALGIDPYPAAGWNVTAYASEVNQQFSDERYPADENGETAYRVSMAGRVMSFRVMGKAAFFHLADATGQVQVYLRRDDLPPDYYNQVFKKLIDLGDFVGIEGFVFRTRTGEVSVHALRFELLAKALRPLPMEKEADGVVYNAITDKEFRYRQRYVDLALHPDVRRVFVQRARLLRAMREFLDARGYIEVETPVLQPVYGGASARPFTTHHNALDIPLFLRIADELYLKRCLVGGFEGVYEISKDFRNEGLSRFHNPEFTMMELYVAFKDYRWMMDLVEEMVEFIALAMHGTTELRVGENTISFARPWARVRFLDAIEERTGRTVRGLERDALANLAHELGIEVTSAMGVGKLLDELFGAFVEPHLIQPTFVTDYPVELSPLAKRHRDEPGLVERFEAICNGKEICNSFSELNDPEDQRARFESQGALRAQGDDEAMQIDEDFLRALEYGMPPTAGLGIGIDRLTMILTNQPSIRDVILFPLLRPEEPS